MSSRQQDHPDQNVLTDFGLGRLDAAESSWIEEHLAGCKECCDTLFSLKDDTFAGIVRTLPKAEERDPDGDDFESVTETPGPRPTKVEATCDSVVDGASVHAAAMPIRSDDAVEPSELPGELKDHPRYRIVEWIGSGGMGDVYRAEHKLMNRPVALKLINSQLVKHPQAVERFRREVRAAAQLTHPNIVTAHDAEQAGKVHFLAMEFVEGTDMATAVRHRGALPVGDACDYIRQAAKGLQHAHEKGMVHRDIKPHNLMLSPGGRVRILDFGLAGFATESANIGSDARAGDTTPLHLTTMGSVMGTPDYIAPEQARDAHSADIRADIYGLGCTFYYLLTGEPPHTSGSVVDKLRAHAAHEPQAVESVRVDIPAELAGVVRRMMAKDPAERFQTPAEVADALASFVDTHQSDRGADGSIGDTLATAVAEPMRFASHVLTTAGWLCVIAAILAIGNRGWITFQYPEWCAPWLTIGSMLSLPVGLVMLRAAADLKRRRSRRVVLTIAALGLLPWNPTSVAMLPLMLWLLRCLRRPEIAAVFGRGVARPEPVARRSPVPRRVCLAMSVLIGIGLAGGIVHFGTDSGQLIIEVDDPDLTVKISRSGRTMRLLENGDTRVTYLPSGDYRITIPGNDGTITVSPDRVEIARGMHRMVTIRSAASQADPGLAQGAWIPEHVEPSIPEMPKHDPTVFERWAGHWEATYRHRDPDGKVWTGRGSADVRRILDDQCILWHWTSDVADQEAFTLVGFDERIGAYREWGIDLGAGVFERTGWWDAESGTLALYMKRNVRGNVSNATTRFVGPDRMETLVIDKDRDNHVLCETQATWLRTAPVVENDIPVVSGPADEPEELATLQKLAGTWHVTQTLKPSVSNPDGKTESLTERADWVLGGEALLIRGFDTDGALMSLSLLRWKAKDRAYRDHFFSPKFRATWSVTWSESSNEFRWQAIDLPVGWTGTRVNRWINNDTIESETLIRDDQDRAALDSSQTKQRLKNQQ